MEVVFLYDFFWDVTEFEFCKLGSFELCHEKVNAHELRTCVEMTLSRNMLIRSNVDVLVSMSFM